MLGFAFGPPNGRIPNVGVSNLRSILVTNIAFFSHQWVFITDTVDAVYRPDGSFPEAMMDQMAEVVTTLPVAVSFTSICPNPILNPLGNITFPVRGEPITFGRTSNAKAFAGSCSSD